MSENHLEKKIYRFGEMELNSAERILLRDGERVSLTPRMFDLLVRLVKADGHLVDKDTLLREVWADANVEEGNLNRTISALRKALGETKNENRYIETVPKTGYRFVAKILSEPSAVAGGLNSAELQIKDYKLQNESEISNGQRKKWLIPLAALILIGVFALGFFAWRGRQNVSPVKSDKTDSDAPQRLTENKDFEDNAEWTRDNRIRFVRISGNKGLSYWMNADGGNQTLANAEIKNLKTGIWSPDGKKVLFNKDGESSQNLYLADFDGKNEVKFPFPPAPLDWSSDSSKIVFSTNFPADKGGTEILIYALETGKVTNISNHPSFDANPSFSPDGKQVIFNSDRDGNHEIYVQNTDGSGVRRLTNHPAREAFHAFSPDGTQIVFNSKRENENVGIYLMNVADDAPPKRISGANYNAEIRPRCWSPDGTKIVFTSDLNGENYNIYTMNVEPFKPQIVFLDDAAEIQSAAYSPDGQQIVYAAKLADRSGELKLYNVASKQTQTLLKTENPDLFPSFAPDGKTIIFNRKIGGNTEICTIKTDGNDLKNLSNHPARDTTAAFLPDGNEIIFSSDREGNFEQNHLYRMKADGSNARRITAKNGYEMFPALAPDGKNIVFSGDRADGKSLGLDIFLMNLSDPTDEKILSVQPFHDTSPAFAPDGKKLVFMATRDLNSEIYLINTDGTGLLRLTRNAAEDITPQWTKDGKKIIFSSNRSGKYALYEIGL